MLRWVAVEKRLRAAKEVTVAYTKASNKALVHAHHIVMKGETLGNKIRIHTIKAQELLKRYNVDLLDGGSRAAEATGLAVKEARIKRLAEQGDYLDNLCWANREAGYYTSKGRGKLHGAEYQKAVYDNLKKVVDDAKKLKSTDEQIAAAIKTELRRMATILEKGEAFW